MKKWWHGGDLPIREGDGQIFEISIVVVDIPLTMINGYLVPARWVPLVLLLLS
jgi:hypothetical protein